MRSDAHVMVYFQSSVGRAAEAKRESDIPYLSKAARLEASGYGAGRAEAAW